MHTIIDILGWGCVIGAALVGLLVFLWYRRKPQVPGTE